jgi:hypothetical protein
VSVLKNPVKISNSKAFTELQNDWIENAHLAV